VSFNPRALIECQPSSRMSFDSRRQAPAERERCGCCAGERSAVYEILVGEPW
jgi:hypothetical protein